MKLDAYVDTRTKRVVEVFMQADTSGDELLLKYLMEFMRDSTDGDEIIIATRDRTVTWRVSNE